MDTGVKSVQTGSMRTCRVSWLIAVPLMAAGAFAARAAAFVCVPPPGGETGSETAEHLRAGASGVQWSLVLGVVSALVVVGVLLQTAELLNGRRTRTASPWTFFVFPPLAFLGQEVAERVLHAEAGFGSAALSHIALGLAMQLPFALLAFLLTFAVRAAATRLATVFKDTAMLPCAAVPSPRVPHGNVGRPSCTLLALGHPQRGPPIRS